MENPKSNSEFVEDSKLNRNLEDYSKSNSEFVEDSKLNRNLEDCSKLNSEFVEDSKLNRNLEDCSKLNSEFVEDSKLNRNLEDYSKLNRDIEDESKSISPNINNIKSNLDEFLKDCTKLVILGIGNDIRGDDGLGPYIINRLFDFKEGSLDLDCSSSLKMYCSNKINDLNQSNQFNNLVLFDAGSVPENFTGAIKKENPSHILIIDASLMGKNPGDVNIVSKENIVNLSVSTHSMSLAYLIKYLETDSEFNILFIGVEPEAMELSFDLSNVVKKTCDDLITVILDSILVMSVNS